MYIYERIYICEYICTYIYITTNCSRIPLIAQRHLGGPLTNSLMTRWSMNDVSLSPMHNAGIY